MPSRLVFAMTGATGVTGGIAAVSTAILTALASMVAAGQTSLTVLSLLEDESARPAFLPRNVVFRAFRGRRPRFAAALLGAVARRPVFVFDHVTLALPILPFAASGTVRTVIFAHGSESWRRIRRTSRWSFRAATLCLTNSHFTLRRMRETLPVFRGEACLLGLSPQFPLNADIPVPQGGLSLDAVDGVRRVIGPRMLLLAARMDPRERAKGYDEVIEALTVLVEDVPDIQAVIAGPGGDADRVRALAHSRNVADRVFVPGFVPQETLARLYGACYAFVMPSRQEGFGLAYLEAMNYGKPCVGCTAQGAEDVIVHEVTGFLLNDGADVQELAEVLRRLLKDPVLARGLGAAGFARLHAAFTAEQFQQRVRTALSAVAC
jgi:glycosyltransferase involved in cell wall biosynthesis